MCRTEIQVLLGIVDRMESKVTWLEMSSGWKCIVSGIDLEPHQGIGPTPGDALLEVLRLAMVCA